MSRLVQLLTDPDDDDTQLAALQALGGLWYYSGTKSDLAGQPWVVGPLVRLLHDGDAVKQAAAVGASYGLLVHHGRFALPLPQLLAPAHSSLNSWPVMSGLVVVLQSSASSPPILSAKSNAAAAMCVLMTFSKGACLLPAAFQLHPDAQAAVAPLVALLQHAVGSRVAAVALGALAEGCPDNQSLIGTVDGAIRRLWQVTKLATDSDVLEALAAVIKGHGVNQGYLMGQNFFMEDLVEMLRNRSERFSRLAALLGEDNPNFVLKLCNTPLAVPALTAALDPSDIFCSDSDRDSDSDSVSDSIRQHKQILALLLSMYKAQPNTILAISGQPGMKDKLQQLSKVEQLFPDATSLLQLVLLHTPSQRLS